MRKKMYWGLASLILIIGVVGVYFMLQPEPDTEPEKRFIVPTEAELEKAREARKPPPGASPNGHWHGDEWHDESHAEPATVPHTQTVSTEEAASDDIVWTIESMKRSRENLLNSLPIYIETNKKQIPSLEEALKRMEGNTLVDGHRDQVKKTLDRVRSQLSHQQELFERLSQPDGLEYLIRRRGAEELLTEVDNEK